MTDQYDNAYSKIMDWVYENIPHNVDKPIEIDFPHDTYGHRAARIYPSGKLTLLKGSWGWGFDEEYELYSIWNLDNQGNRMNSGDNNPLLQRLRTDIIRKFVDNWKDYMKPRVLKAFEKYADLDNFEA